jgi:hypothetical protein
VLLVFLEVKAMAEQLDLLVQQALLVYILQQLQLQVQTLLLL